jgi:hypothetical protein
MRAMQDGGAELDRLDRILSAMLHQRAADEHGRNRRDGKQHLLHGYITSKSNTV